MVLAALQAEQATLKAEKAVAEEKQPMLTIYAPITAEHPEEEAVAEPLQLVEEAPEEKELPQTEKPEKHLKAQQAEQAE